MSTYQITGKLNLKLCVSIYLPRSIYCTCSYIFRVLNGALLLLLSLHSWRDMGFFLPHSKVKCFPTFSVIEGLLNLCYFPQKQSNFVTRKLHGVSIRRIALYIRLLALNIFVDVLSIRYELTSLTLTSLTHT